jgi:hypothetical protein
VVKQAPAIFDTSAQTLSTLMLGGQSFYYIPAYQREYNWQPADVLRVMEGVIRGLLTIRDDDESFNFLGTIIITEDKTFKTVDPIHRPDMPSRVLLVIDGQQRLTTLVLITIALHGRLRKNYDRLVDLETSIKSSLEKYIEQETAKTLKQISNMLIYDEFIPPDQTIPFVRIIRAFEDTWSKDSINNKYESPIAKLIYEYGITKHGFDLSQPKANFQPPAYAATSNRNVCRKRYLEIVKILTDAFENGVGDEELKLPHLKTLLDTPNVIQELLSTISDADKDSLLQLSTDDLLNGEINYLLLTRFVLHRVVLTSVLVKEEYAFDVFDSLNTTGKPLTPFEMFRPLVMDAVGLSNYQISDDKIIIDEIGSSLGDLDIEANITEAKKIVINFALSESGHQLGTDRVAQRNYFRVSYNRTKQNSNYSAERLAYIKNLQVITNFHKSILKNPNKPQLPGLHWTQVSDESQVCLSLLAKNKFTLAVPILARFWSNVEDATSPQTVDVALREFETIVKGVTAFAVLYRAVSPTTDGIDKVWRELLTGISSPTNLGPLQRSNFDFLGVEVKKSTTIPKASDVLKDLYLRLTDSNHRNVSNRSDFVSKARDISIYKVSQPVARFLLFAAMHDNIHDPNDPACLLKGINGCHSTINLKTWVSEEGLSVEHVAPQTRSLGWDSAIYQDLLIDTLGNLTLCPQSINGLLGNESWIRKRDVYKALGNAAGLIAAQQTLLAAIPPYTKLANAIKNEDVGHCKFFGNIGDKTDSWDKTFIERRSDNLLGFAWDRLISWLN